MTRFAAVLVAVVTTGCGSSSASAERSAAVQPTYSSGGRLEKLAYDSNGNGTHDTWAYMDGARLIRLEADENENGKVERWEFYPSSGAPGPKQPPERIERATRDDGVVSRREYFEGGDMTRVEEDTDGNGAVDKWETYKDGTLVLLALDTSNRGRPDRRLVYTADGSLDRIEADPAGTGHFQPIKP